MSDGINEVLKSFQESQQTSPHVEGEVTYQLNSYGTMNVLQGL